MIPELSARARLNRRFLVFTLPRLRVHTSLTKEDSLLSSLFTTLLLTFSSQLQIPESVGSLNPGIESRTQSVCIDSAQRNGSASTRSEGESGVVPQMCFSMITDRIVMGSFFTKS